MGDGKPAVFQSEDGEISFDTERIKRIVANQNAKIDLLAADYGGLDKMPMGAHLPILDMHMDESGDRVGGRLASRLEFEVRDVPGVGKNCSCAVADITFLGGETVKKVNDGRIYHLSIGINEESDTLGEVSTVIEPAAPGAMLLSRGTKPKGDEMSAKQKRLEAKSKRMARLGAIKENLTKLTAGIGTANETVKLARRKGEVTHRLTGLMRSSKLTPAEFKKMDLVKLSKLDDSALDTVLGTFEAREPVIPVGQRGSTEGVEFASIGKDLAEKDRKRLRSEIKKDFKRLGKKMSEDDGDDKESHLSGPKEHPVTTGKDPHSVPGSAGDEEQLKHAAYMSLHEEMKKHLAAGDVGKAKETHEKMLAHHGHSMKHMGAAGPGDVASEDYKKSMDHLQGQIDELHTQMARCAGMVEEAMSDEANEPEHQDEKPAQA